MRERNIRDVRFKMFLDRKRELEVRLNEATMKKHQVNAKIRALDNERQYIEDQIASLKTQLDSVTRELGGS